MNSRVNECDATDCIYNKNRLCDNFWGITINASGECDMYEEEQEGDE